MKKKNENNTKFQVSKHEPFAIAEINGKFQIVVGEYLVSNKTFDTIEQAEKYIGMKPYDLIFNTALVFFKLQTEQKNEVEEIKETNN